MPDHFNKLNPTQAELLAILAEECGEVIQIVGKILRHGYDSKHPDGGPTNRELLSKEICDVDAVWGAIRDSGDALGYSSVDSKDAWARKLQYAHHQQTDALKDWRSSSTKTEDGYNG